MRTRTWSLELYLAEDSSGTGETQFPFLDTNIQLRDPNNSTSNASVTVPYKYTGTLGKFTWLFVYGVRTDVKGNREIRELFRGEITGSKHYRGFSGGVPTHTLTLLSEGQVQPIPEQRDNFLPPPNEMDSTTVHERMLTDPSPGKSSRQPPPGPGLTTMGGGGDDASNDARPGEDAVTDEGPAGKTERQKRRNRIKEMQFTKDGAKRVSLGEPSEALTEKIC